jgi:hypothetical protein
MAIKDLGASPILAAEISKEIPLTRLERFSFCQCLFNKPHGDSTAARKGIAQAFERSKYDFDSEAEAGLQRPDYELLVQVTLTEAQIREAIKLCDDFAKGLPGKLGFAVLDLRDRLDYVKTGLKE